MKQITKKILVGTIAGTFSISALVAATSVEKYKENKNLYVNSFKGTNSAILNYSTQTAQSPDQVQISNLALLTKKLSGAVKLKNPNKKASDIAASINKAQNLNGETNIDLATIKGSTFVITAKSTLDGEIELSVEMTTKGAKTEKSTPVKATINEIKKISAFGIEDDKPTDPNVHRNSHTETLNVVSSDNDLTVRVDFDFATVSSKTVHPSLSELKGIANGKDTDLFSELKKRIFLSKKNGKWSVLNGKVQTKEFTSETNAIDFKVEGWGAQSKNTGTLKIWISNSNSKTGEVEISTQLTQSNGDGEDAVILKNFSAQGFNQEYSKDLIKAKNYEELQKIINNAKPFKRPKGTDANIVKMIKDVNSLKKLSSGIDFSNIKGSDIAVNSKLNNHGSIEINIEMTTPGARDEKSKAISIIFDEAKIIKNFSIDDDQIKLRNHSKHEVTFTEELTINDKGALRVFFDASTVKSSIVKPFISDLIRIVNGNDKKLFSKLQREVILEMDKNGKWNKADGVSHKQEITKEDNAVEITINGEGSASKNKLSVKIWIAHYDPLTKKAKVSVKFELEDHSGEDAALIQNLTFQAINDKYQNNILKVNNLAKLNAALNGKTTIKVPTDKASEIVKRISDVASLKDELGIDLTGITGSTFKVLAKGESDGIISITVTMTTPNATTPDSAAITKDVQQLSDAKLDANQLQKDNLAKLNTALNGATTIKVPTDKASEIVKRISDVASLKDELGIDLTAIKSNGSTFTILATGATDGTISISVTMTTPNATTPDSAAITKDVQQLSDAKLDANQLQKDNLAKLNTALNGATTIKVPTDKASEIVKRISDVASLKDELGIDLTAIKSNGSTFTILATGATDGTISISVTMTTAGATTPDSAVQKKDIQHTPDKKIIANADQLQKDNLAKLKAVLNGKRTIKIPTDKASDIASRIKDATSLKKELGIDLTNIKGSTFKVSAKGSTDGKISISVTMTTTGSTTPYSNTATKDIKHLSDAEIQKNIGSSKNNSNKVTWIIIISILGVIGTLGIILLIKKNKRK